MKFLVALIACLWCTPLQAKPSEKIPAELLNYELWRETFMEWVALEDGEDLWADEDDGDDTRQ